MLRNKLFAATLTLGVASGIAYAAVTADDFKNAVSKTGCDSIPYANERDDCKKYGALRDEWCKGGRGEF